MMSEQDRVKKAIEDRGVPGMVAPSHDDMKRYSHRDLNRMILGDFGMGLPPVPVPENIFTTRMRGELEPSFSVPHPNDHLLINGVSNATRLKWDDFPRASAVTIAAMEREMRNAYMFYGHGLETFMGFDLGTPDTATAVLEPPPEMPRPSKDVLQRYQITEQNVTDMRSGLAVEAEALLGYSVLRKRLGLHSPLTVALMQLEIEPFESKSVDAYKKQMLDYARNEAARMDVAEGTNPKSYKARVASWRTHGIRGYTKPIPEFAIDTAVRLKKACPEVEFQIEELTIVPDPFLIAVLGNVRRYIEVWDEPKFEGR